MTARELPEKFLVAFSFAGGQRNYVREIAEAVERELGQGQVFFDEWYEHHLAGPAADLKLQRIYGQHCALVVYCVSGEYGKKEWTVMEHDAIRARQMKARVATDPGEGYSIMPIRVGDGPCEGLSFNEIAPDVRERGAIKTAELIVNRLQLVLKARVPVQASTSAWPADEPSLVWPMANHSGARDAFAALLTAGSPYRFLPLQGPSGTGKSHIADQMLRNALTMPNIACGKFDFKGTTDMDLEVRVLIRDLDVAEPRSDLKLPERLDQILASLRSRGKPALLIFDTYELAGAAKVWVEKQLLTALIRAPWLRVAILGQKTPSPVNAVWSGVSAPTIELRPPPPQEWFDFGKQHRQGLTLHVVEQLCALADHKPGLLAQLLGPRN